MKKQKIATRTTLLWYKAIYITEDKNPQLCEYKVDTFKTPAEAIAFLHTQLEKQKGYMAEKIQRDVYLVTE